MIGIQYISACKDISGYAQASRNHIVALSQQDQIDLTLKIVSFENEKVKHEQYENLLSNLCNKSIDYKINIVFLTPENFPLYYQKDKYNIGCTCWETDKLPEGWTNLCNNMDEIWVPSQYNVEVFRNSGVIKPVTKIPYVIDIPDLTTIEKIPFSLDKNTYVFYFIGQWIERKGIISMLKAYLSEFNSEDNVLLAIKTYVSNTGNIKNKLDKVKDDINLVKRSLNLSYNPPIFLCTKFLSNTELLSFHASGDCLVHSAHGEGWGLTCTEAMSIGNPVITTNYSGMLEFCNNKNSYLIDNYIVPVYGMPFAQYNAKMNWSEPRVDHLKKLMRYVYENQEKAFQVGNIAKAEVVEKFNTQIIGKIMKDRLEVISSNL